MPIRVDSATAAQDWATSLGNKTAKIQAGINRVTQSPGQKAVAQADKYIQGVQAGLPKWKTKLQALTVGDWQQAALAGVPRVAQGAQAKQGKMQAALEKNFAMMTPILARIDGMPTTTIAQRIQKSSAFQQAMYDAARGQTS